MSGGGLVVQSSFRYCDDIKKKKRHVCDPHGPAAQNFEFISCSTVQKVCFVQLWYVYSTLVGHIKTTLVARFYLTGIYLHELVKIIVHTKYIAI